MSKKSISSYQYKSQDLIHNPISLFNEIRAKGDLVWSTSFGYWLTGSKSAVAEVLAERNLAIIDVFDNYERLDKLTHVNFKPIKRMLEWIPFLHDGEQHAQLRSLFARVINQILAEYLKHFEQVSKQLLDQLVAKQRGDFVTDYSDHLHTYALSAFCGFSQEDAHEISLLAATAGNFDFAASAEKVKRASENAEKLTEKIRGLLESQQEKDWVKNLQIHLSKVGLDTGIESQMKAFSALIFLGGDALSGTLSIALAHLFDAHNGRLESGIWCNEPWFMNELVRISSTIQTAVRVATQELTICGQTVQQGEKVLVFFPAANHDPGAYDSPAHLSSDHATNLGFSAGRHLCTGKPMSLKALAIVVSHLAELKSISALPGRKLSNGTTIRKYQSLPVCVER